MFLFIWAETFIDLPACLLTDRLGREGLHSWVREQSDGGGGSWGSSCPLWVSAASTQCLLECLLENIEPLMTMSIVYTQDFVVVIWSIFHVSYLSVTLYFTLYVLYKLKLTEHCGVSFQEASVQFSSDRKSKIFCASGHQLNWDAGKPLPLSNFKLDK